MATVIMTDKEYEDLLVFKNEALRYIEKESQNFPCVKNALMKKYNVKLNRKDLEKIVEDILVKASIIEKIDGPIVTGKQIGRAHV